MVEKNDQKKCRDISTEIQEILAKWGKYFFYYYPKEHRIRPSEFAARHMGIVENPHGQNYGKRKTVKTVSGY